jgi:peptidoglycan/xylan/chitin deacetylase (PgdA/CDA1 family)
MYHRLGAPLDPADEQYCVRPEDFSRHVSRLAREGYHAVSLDAFVAWLDGREALRQGALLITFDDGFRGVYEHAYPILGEMGWPFTVFLVSGQIGGRDTWNPSGSSELLGQEEILAMAAEGVRFESHTRTHRRLAALSDDHLLAELAGAKADLETLLGRPVQYLAYPFGEHDERVCTAAKAAGYAAAFTTQPGFNRREVDRFRIRRLDIRGTDSPVELTRKLVLGTNDGSLRNMVGYFGRRVARAVWS